MANGLLSIRHRAVKTVEVVRQQKQSRAIRGGTYRYFVRGKTHQPSQVSVFFLQCNILVYLDFIFLTCLI